MAPLAPLLLLPLLELGVFVLVCLSLGFWVALALVLATSVCGGLVLRLQGSAALRRVRHQLETGQSAAALPPKTLWLTVVGVLLLIPGFCSDLLALALLVPPLRRGLGRLLLKALPPGLFRAGTTRAYPPRSDFSGYPKDPAKDPAAAPPPSPGPVCGPVIDVEFEDLPPRPPTR